MSKKRRFITEIYMQYSMLISMSMLIVVASCQSKNEDKGQKWASYGEALTPQNSISTSKLLTEVAGSDSLVVKFEAEIDEVCQMKGCWMTLKTEDGTRAIAC